MNPRNFFAELKRRNVYKVGAAYVVVGWLLIQVATQTFPFFEIPNWGTRLVILLLIIGFPVALLLAWAFELTPEGLRRTDQIAAPSEEALSSLLDRNASSIRSLAVLPLMNVSTNPETDYLSEGISEGIINTLSQLPSVRVLARNTVFRYKDADPLATGRALKVDAVLAGTLSERGEQLVIKAELIVTADGTQAWGERFTFRSTEIGTAEELLSTQIANKLRVRLSSDERGSGQKQIPQNAESYRLYLRGRYQWAKRTEAGLHKAIADFKEAIDKDPNYARAWAGLADCYTILGCWGYEAPHHSYPKARAAAERALQLDGSLSEAHVSLAVAKKDYYWDWEGAETEYKRALVLNPGNATARQWYAEFLACLGRHAEAIAECERARELDPLSLIVAATLGRHGYSLARQYDRAIAELREIVRTDPQFWVAHVFLGFALLYDGQPQAALAEFTQAKQMDENADVQAGLGFALARLDRHPEARAVIAELKTLRDRRYVQSVAIAVVYVGLGENNNAFLWLEKAYEEHAQWLSEIKVDPLFDRLRQDARLDHLLRRLGLLR